MTNSDQWLSVKEATEVIGGSTSSLRNLIRDGKIEAVQHVPGGKFHVRLSECLRYLDSRKTKLPAA